MHLPLALMTITIHSRFVTCSSLFILSLESLFQASLAITNPYCAPSACGPIRNISYPFRLRGDPDHCGLILYELLCENDDVTSINLNFGSQKYYVKAINYNNFTIRLADVSVNNDICSFPIHSLYQSNFPFDYPYSIYKDKVKKATHEVAWPINFLSCPFPLLNSSRFTEAVRCSGEASRYTYAKVGHSPLSDLMYSCQLELSVLTSWKFKNANNVSLSEIHDALLYGFELSWFDFNLDIVNTVLHYSWHFIRMIYFAGSNSVLAVLILILLLILVVLFAAVSLAATFVVGLLICAPILMYFINKTFLSYYLSYYAIGLVVLNPPFVVVVGYGARFIFGFAFIMWVLIKKYRRRRLSMFDAIEGFLQSENNLMPIRYSYSHIKRITKGFRVKLGEGGYGSVYKGKLRSGNDVAVKLLGKNGATGQDFVNEISTIGRIHHVNVVKLVGYCAERSKRALVFDFMPNGSLEKYIFDREKMNLLSWDTKFDIATGVARGIEYLHRGCDVHILHFDIKPHNILLDHKFIPKISDFGLAKVCSTDKNTVSMTAARGTIGYVAPELISRSIGAVSYKADVYSFGMLLMEMVGLKRELARNVGNSSKYFPYWIYDHFNEGKDIEIGNTSENDNINDSSVKLVRKMTIVALWCILMNPDDRPSMDKVLEMLEADVERLKIPEYPSQDTHTTTNADKTGTTRSTDSMSLLHDDDDHDDASPSVEITVQE